MPSTTRQALRYPASNDPPNGPVQIGNLAADTDARPTFRGVGSSWPTNIVTGDTFYHTTFKCTMRAMTTGGSWKQDDIAFVTSDSDRTAYLAALTAAGLGVHEGFLVWQTDTNALYGGDTGNLLVPVDLMRQATMWRTSGLGAVTNANTYEKVGFDSARVAGGMTFDAADDSVTLPASGFYEVNGRGYISGSTGYIGRFRMMRNRSGSGDKDLGTSGALRKVDTLDELDHFSSTVPLQAGDKVFMQANLSDTSGRYYGLDEATGIQLRVRYLGPLGGATPY